MRIKNYLLSSFTACVLVASCTSSNENEHLPKEKMKEVLFDINLAEVYSNMVPDSTHKKGSKNADSLARYYQVIFSHHSITKEQFAQSLSWYKSHPDDMDSVYTHMIQKAEVLQATVK